MYDRENSVGVFVDGHNAEGEEIGLHLLDYFDALRFDDGKPHQVDVSFTPATPIGRIEVRFDGSPHATLSVPISLDPGDAYVGFTASTGLASEKHDIRDFSFCQKPGCVVS